MFNGYIFIVFSFFPDQYNTIIERYSSTVHLLYLENTTYVGVFHDSCSKNEDSDSKISCAKDILGINDI